MPPPKAPTLHRRKFMGLSAAALAGAASSKERAFGAPVERRDKPIGLGLIGCGRQGRRDLLTALNVGTGAAGCRAMADPDDNQSALAMRALDDVGHGPKRERYKDYRRVLDDATVDAVLIATPDHWHALAVVDALDAGKDVYLAAPATAMFGELAPVVRRAEVSRRVVQLGLENRSLQNVSQLRESLSQIGTVASVRAWSFDPGARPLPVEGPSVAPAYCDYEMWLGPAPHREFTMNRFHDRHQWFWDYGGGYLSRRGIVWLDLAAQLMDLEAPNHSFSSGGNHRFPADERETPDTQSVTWSFDQVEVNWHHGLGIDSSGARLPAGVAFEGSDGTLLIHADGWEVRVEDRTVDSGTLPSAQNRHERHMANFLDCVRSRESPTATLTDCQYSTLWSQLANASLRSGLPVNWDRASGSVVRSEEIDRYLFPTYREPWRLPV